MAKTESQMLELGTVAPPFSLPHVDGEMVSLEVFQGAPALLVMFICNHCPFVIHIREELASLGAHYRARGVGVVAINSNDTSTHPADAPDAMREEAARWGYTFPYLFDESQAVAKSCRAACTPDFYLFDANHKLADSTMMLVASPEYLRERGEPRRIRDLAKHDCVVFGSLAPQVTWPLRGKTGLVNVSVTSRISVNHLQAAKSAALAGLGIAMIPGAYGVAEIHAGTLAVVLPEVGAPAGAL